MRPEATAYHEAGHAVAQHAFGRALDRVTILPDPETLSGGAMHTREIVPPNLVGRGEPATFTNAEIEEVERTVIVMLAGGIAERLAGDYAPGGARGDQEAIAELLPLLAKVRGVEEDAYIREVTSKAGEFVLANRAAIKLLAEELLRRETLSGAEVARLLSGPRS